jgi:cytochrome P450
MNAASERSEEPRRLFDRESAQHLDDRAALGVGPSQEVAEHHPFKEKSTAVARFDPDEAARRGFDGARPRARALPRGGARRREPRDDLISALLAAEIDGERLSE